ncbi:MAG: GIY-YIG nuclease family protein [Labrenzia sp.]
MRSERAYFVYILTNRIGGTLYVGMTNNLIRRISEHRDGTGSIFTRQHQLHRLLYFEMFERPEEAYQREHNIKKWKRSWKIRMIEEHNPDWVDLFPSLNTQ